MEKSSLETGMEYTHRKMITRLKSHYKSIVVWAQLLLLEASFSKYRTEKEDEIGLAIQRPSPLASTARGDRAERTNKQPNLMRCIGKKGPAYYVVILLLH